ncbi:MAG: hypothetical protein AAFN79_11095 [Pseudomonadota bacterium]
MKDRNRTLWRADRAILHIGAPKTGTTSIQNVCARGRAQLRAEGTLYPESLGRTSHQLFAAAMGRLFEPDGLRRALGVGGARRVLRLRSDLSAALRREVEETRPETLIISAENLFANVRSVGDARRIARFLKPFAKSVEIVVYLRRQDRAMFSAWTHALRIGKSADFAVPSRFQRNGRHDYAGRLRHWRRAFGADAIYVAAFDGVSDVVADFFDCIGIDPPETPKGSANRSLDQVRAAFMAAFNEQVPRFVDGALNPARGDLSEAIDDAPGLGAPARLAARDARAILALYARSNARLARDWNGGAPLFDDALGEGASEVEPVEVEDVVAIAARLWRRKQEEIARLRAQLATTRALPKNVGRSGAIRAPASAPSTRRQHA